MSHLKTAAYEQLLSDSSVAAPRQAPWVVMVGTRHPALIHAFYYEAEAEARAICGAFPLNPWSVNR